MRFRSKLRILLLRLIRCGTAARIRAESVDEERDRFACGWPLLYVPSAALAAARKSNPFKTGKDLKDNLTSVNFSGIRQDSASWS